MRVNYPLPSPKREGFFNPKIPLKTPKIMIQEIREHRNRRPVSAEARKITSGANALDLFPRISSRPELHVVKQPSELPKPINIKDFLRRKSGALVELPSTSEAITRQQIIEGSPEAKPRFIERELNEKKPWSAFGQTIITMEHVNPETGEVTKNWVGFSVSLPGGVGEIMTQEMLGKAAGFESSDFQSWDGEVEGKLIAAHKPVTNALEQLDIFDKFVDISEQVILDNHANVNFKGVQHFLSLQQARRKALDRAKESASEMLSNPNFQCQSAYQEEFNNTGFYLIGGVIKDKIWYGPNVQGELVPIESVIDDDPHMQWIKFGAKKQNETEGDSVTVHGDSTEKVSFCGGVDDDNKRGCSEIFAQREGYDFGNKESKVSEYAVVSGIAGSIAASEYSESSHVSGGGGASYDIEYCSSCGKNKHEEDGCKCS